MRYFAAWLLWGALLALLPTWAHADGERVQRIELGRLSFEVTGDWLIHAVKGEGASATLSADIEGEDGGGLLLLSAPRPAPELSQSGLDRVATAISAGWAGVRSPQWTSGRTRSGISYVTYRARPGPEYRGFLLYFVFDVGDAVQVLSLRAKAPEVLVRMEKLVRSGLTSARLLREAPVPAGAGKTGLEVAERPAAPSAPKRELVVADGFSIVYAKAWDLMAADKWEFSRDRSGKLWFALAHSHSTYGRLPWEGVFHTFDGEGQLVKSGPTSDSLGEALGEGFVDEFDSVEVDAAGNFFVGAHVGSYSRGGMHNVFAVGRPDTGRWESVAPRGTVLTLGDGSGWGSDALLRPTPTGDAWLFVKQGKGPMRIGYLQRGPEGGWSLSEVPVGELLARKEPASLKWGAADFQGNYLFHASDGFWRLGRDGRLTRIGQVDLPDEERSNVSRPVILPNGDIWVALSQSGNVLQYTTEKNERTLTLHSFASLTGRSALVRIRLDAQGRPTLRVIHGTDLLVALQKAGMPIRSRVLTMSGLWVDWSTGGLLTYDSQHDVIFSVRPHD